MALSLPGAASGTPTAPDLPGLPPSVPAAKEKAPKILWPADLPAQATAVRQTLTTLLRGATPARLATRFSKAPKATLTQLLETLAALGLEQQSGDLYTAS